MPSAVSPSLSSTPLGATIRARREEAGVEQADLASRVGISPGHLSRCERGERVISRETYEALIEALAELAAEQRGAA
ncbi:helix-turn-helix domain-containing protein [Terrabacter terrigena]